MTLADEHRCEHCHRNIEQHQMMKLQIDAYIGYICPTCHHIFSMQQHQVRFQQMIRKKTYEQSNEDMQQVHKMLSTLIGTGVVLSAIAFSVLLLQVADVFPSIDVLF